MKQEIVNEVMQRMQPFIDNGQLKNLEQILKHVLFDYEITEQSKDAQKKHYHTTRRRF